MHIGFRTRRSVLISKQIILYFQLFRMLFVKKALVKLDSSSKMLYNESRTILFQ